MLLGQPMANKKKRESQAPQKPSASAINAPEFTLTSFNRNIKVDEEPKAPFLGNSSLTGTPQVLGLGYGPNTFCSVNRSAPKK